VDIKIQIIKAGDFIKSTPTGNLDLVASKEGLALIAKSAEHLHDYTILIDLREVTSSLTESDLFDLGAHLEQYGNTFNRKTAILIRLDGNILDVNFFKKVAQTWGFRVSGFTSFEEAIHWLAIPKEVVSIPKT